MEDILKSINSISGVMGSFICDGKGKILASIMPDPFDETMVLDVGRTITQSMSGLATMHRRRIEDIDMVYDQGRFITRNLGDSILCILCIRNMNVPLLNMTANLAVKKLTKMLVEYKEKDIQETKVQDEWKSRAQWLNTEVQSIVAAAREKGVIIQATGDAAIRLRCPSAAQLALSLEENVLDLVCREKQVGLVSRVVEELGYAPERNFNMLHGSQRLRFTSNENKLGLEIFLDSLKMYHSLHFSDSLHLGDETIPLADLLLWKLQVVELDEDTIKSICVIINDHELGGPGELEKIDSNRITSLCAADWGWYKTVTNNLEKCISWAEDRPDFSLSVFLDRARTLLKTIVDVPKSGGWQLRARIGESMRWYEIPE
jgi:predicted regulator of Ras-like GTPase activity (Roadblock/LC7/MglB family)